MSLAKDLFSQLKTLRKTLEEEIDGLEAEREQLKTDRRAVSGRPRPKEDLAEEAAQLVDAKIQEARAGFAAKLRERMQGHIGNPGAPFRRHSTDPGIDLLGVRNLDRVSGASLERLLYVVLGDAIKPAIVQAVLGLPDYPELVGLPLAERKGQLDALDKRIEEINTKLRELLKQADEAGVAF